MVRRALKLARTLAPPRTFGLQSALIVAFASVSAATAGGQPAPQTQGFAWSEEVERELERIRTLVLPQQKAWARRLIRQRPETPMAKAAQQLLEEYRLLDQLRERERREAEAHRRAVRAYWRAKQVPPLTVSRQFVRLTNRSDRAVLYEIKGPSMAWAGPYRLRKGQTHQFVYPAAVRFLVGDQVIEASVTPGAEYVFHEGTGKRKLRLERVSAASTGLADGTVPRPKRF
ncbi:MAG: hypothetical protein GXP27_13580 [Planctomycetes bacterium]|nr:hypothetical protein [Planctomycetota bacterium]